MRIDSLVVDEQPARGLRDEEEDENGEVGGRECVDDEVGVVPEEVGGHDHDDLAEDEGKVDEGARLARVLRTHELDAEHKGTQVHAVDEGAWMRKK